MQRFIPCRFLDVANIMLEITDFCPKLRFFSILITDFSFQRLAALPVLNIRHSAQVVLAQRNKNGSAQVPKNQMSIATISVLVL